MSLASSALTSRTVKTFFDISIGGVPQGRIIFSLFPRIAPVTVLNFQMLCQGGAGVSSTARSLIYIGSRFHRIIPGFMCQGGDFTHGTGEGGESIYGALFNDEGFHLKHDGIGVVSMANSGPNTNGSQFFITFAPCSWLDRKHVAFGKISQGFDILRLIEQQGTKSGKPKQEVLIQDSGVVDKRNRLVI